MVAGNGLCPRHDSVIPVTELETRTVLSLCVTGGYGVLSNPS